MFVRARRDTEFRATAEQGQAIPSELVVHEAFVLDGIVGNINLLPKLPTVFVAPFHAQGRAFIREHELTHQRGSRRHHAIEETE